MAVIKCKMCGGDLNLMEGASTAECEFCGSVQTIPNLDDEKKLIQFERAERLRKQCEFDKAAGIYETIVADFRQEAEAYWGLVLCKYGIEYVDDPATGKKIPTCHRSSFDSIMEDGDFEQTLENADVMARKLYREEAKQIEEIRKGIISVSSNEQPYDVFICYKETDAKGERTLDSVLAQDIYDVLTDKGYRVFFARITLEDKLGMAYEPYIFAALNSAKVMLAVGTDYEYYNAVWVKNEWSRFLKLMAKDKEKHLIPCYKGIDAYDMPKEFARLQAQDLGKVGAMQDLLRGIEKIIPRQTNATTIIQERVVVGGSGDNKIASLLDRGNMALEDGDWAKADSFFEDVLNNDSKNAQAYLGKTLAQEKCRTIDAFARKRKERYVDIQYERLYIQTAEKHIAEAVAKYCIPGYVFQSDIGDLYTFDLGYSSAVSCRQKQYQQEQTYWKDHKLLSKAEKFATGAVAENLQQEKKALFAALTERIKKAETAAADAKEKTQKAYQEHITKADQKAAQLHKEGLQRRDTDYHALTETAKTSTEVQELKDTAQKFDQLGDYQDSKKLAEHCRKRVSEEQAKLDAEKERLRLEQEALDKKKQARNRIIAAVAAGMAVAAIGVAIISSQISKERLRAQNYNEAATLLSNGQYDAAIQAFTQLGDYKDSSEQIIIAQNAKAQEEERLAQAEIEATYQQALALFNDGKCDAAIKLFEQLGDYKDSAEQHKLAQLEQTYLRAISLLKKDQPSQAKARELFLELGDYKDAAQYVSKFVQRVVTRTTSKPKTRDEHISSFYYDAAGFFIRESYQSGNDHIYTWDADHRTVTFSPTTTIDWSTKVITHTFDDAGNLIQWSSLYSDGSGYRSTFNYTYHENGAIATKEENRVDAKNGEPFYRAVTTYTYNANGSLTKSVKELAFALYQDKGKNTTSTTTTHHYCNPEGLILRETEEYTSYSPSTYSSDVKVSSSSYEYKYTYGWVYAPDAANHPVIWTEDILT